MRITTIIWLLVILLQQGCKPEQQASLFTALESEHTGIQFGNYLTPDSAFNMFKYMYFYNGAGVGAGDFNNDGLADLFFAGNQVQDELYINTGNLQFTNITGKAGIPSDGGWSTGVSIVDINQDGLLDIYVCRVGNFETLKGKNQLLICTGIDSYGIPHYTDSASAYGLDFSGFSTQAVFFDYDLDGDLDLFLLNHAVHHSGMFAERSRFLNTFSELSGDRLYRNDNGKYIDVTKESGIHSSEIGYGLGVVVSDLNHDGWPDLYIGNDFHENDYLYINNRDGSFSDKLDSQMMHTSQFSMGVDAADINNDGFPEIISLDMLPADPYILKRSLGEDAHDIFKMKVRYGYHHQYARNNLQLNRGNNYFSEIGLYAGVYATDWSWAPLWMDFDNDGLKDLFISNGIPKRLNDMDYVNFISNREYQDKIRNNEIGSRELALVDRFPEIKLPNFFFKNKGEASFEDIGHLVAGNIPTYSNGAIYADLDNDGDLDVVVNNIAGKALIYENKTGAGRKHSSVQLHLTGPQGNRNAIGAKAVLFSKSEIIVAEKQAVRGFLSSMEVPLHIGTGDAPIDSAWLIWPDNTYSLLDWHTDSLFAKIGWQPNLPNARLHELHERLQPSHYATIEMSAALGIDYLHTENRFNEFDREPLLPKMLSTEGPALAVADINGDGLEDFFIGAARNTAPAVYLQQADGRFYLLKQPALAADSAYEDVDAQWADVNNDGFIDLLVASGGNEFYHEDKHLLPRVYLNDGTGHLARKQDAFEGLYMTWSTIAVHDFNGDGFVDLFLGARAIPFNYGVIPQSFLLQNDGTGRFTDVTGQFAPALQSTGFVTHAIWYDIDNNGEKDLLIATEWDGLQWYKSEKGKLSKEYISTLKGWWNFMMPVDYNMDGHIDVLAGNLGLNSRLKASSKEPVSMYVGDLDDNGLTEQILTYYLDGREIPFANKDELQKQLPGLKKEYLYAEDFAKSSMAELFGNKKLNKAVKHQATTFANAVFINDGNGNFTMQALPWLAQLSSYRTAMAVHANGDSLPDIFLGGNFYENNIQMGRYDADMGTLLINKGSGQYEITNMHPTVERGEIRRVQSITVKGRPMMLMAKNNDRLRLYAFRENLP